MNDIAPSAYLASLLNSIDKTTGKHTDTSLADNKEAVAPSSIAKVPSNWASFEDPTSKKIYYHDYSTGVTQWERPEGFVELVPAYSAAAASSSGVAMLSSLSAAVNDSSTSYAAKATFNRHKGQFANTGSDSYWETKGRQTDKAGRQLQAFIDLGELEKNREETRVMKETGNNKAKYEQWLKQNGGDKKAAKKRKAAAWLYED